MERSCCKQHSILTVMLEARNQCEDNLGKYSTTRLYPQKKKTSMRIDIWELHVVGVINSGQWPLWKLCSKYNSDGRLHSMKVRVYHVYERFEHSFFLLFYCFLIILLTCSDGIKCQ